MFRRNGVISCNKGCKADEHGDTLAGELIARTAYYLGVGMANLINLFNPERIVIGGEEDDVKDEGLKSNLYTTPEDMIEAARRLNSVKGARYLVAATFGNMHGAYKPGHVKLKPAILKEGQNALEKEYGPEGRFFLVFHGGSGSSLDEIHEAIHYGVVKMNIDTDTQYAFTRPIADHMFKNYDGVFKVDGEVGKKKSYDPRTYFALAEASMAERVKQAVNELRGVGTTLFDM